MNTHSINVAAEVSTRDLKDALSFEEIFEIYEPDADEVLSQLGLEQAVEWILQQPALTNRTTLVSGMLDDDAFKMAVLSAFRETDSDLFRTEALTFAFEAHEAAGVEIIRCCSTQTVIGSITFIGNGAAFVSITFPGRDTIRFQCDNERMAKMVINQLNTVQSVQS